MRARAGGGETTMAAKTGNTGEEASLAMTMNALAGKYGCSIRIDYERHTIQIDCPSQEAEMNLALEVNDLLGD